MSENTFPRLLPTQIDLKLLGSYLSPFLCSVVMVYQLNATRLNTTPNLTSLGSLLNWFGIQAIRVYMKLECQTPGYHIVNWMHVIQWLF